ncbi:uncharacterized protein B0I36DRAFT_137410 [Microdochium trichocladiopsis]|uniref:Uncharacterized protein n=1 Tax=Microdochium trichocladiopsis TaxID=1682393 RepID=A0A9P8Y1W1_9PEZI|nr:uncharacterized protein B0I36DRAFT_137410 [Microdochium trichocladiopsis]KAH7027334.1 hypothetical protein B0I36DRAFT_137410 [Microdochium trichocladiopsis]
MWERVVSVLENEVRQRATMAEATALCPYSLASLSCTFLASSCCQQCTAAFNVHGRARPADVYVHYVNE